MSGFQPVVIPDFADTIGRAGLYQQNALLGALRMREAAGQQRVDDIMAQHGAALMSGDAAAKQNVLNLLAQSGARGLALAAPYYQMDQQRYRTLSPQEAMAAGYRPGTVVRENNLGQAQVVQSSDVMSPEAYRQQAGLRMVGQPPRVTWTDVTDDSGNIIGQRASTGQYQPLPASATNMFGSGAGGLALGFLTRSAEGYAAGTLTPDQDRQFESALSIAQQPRVTVDPTTGQMVTVKPELPDFVQQAVQRRRARAGRPEPAQPGQPAGQAPLVPPDLILPAPVPGAPPVPSPAGPSAPIGNTGMAASPPPNVSVRQVGPAQMAPGNVVTGMLENAAALRKVEDTLAALAAPEARNSTGIVPGMTPGFILDRADPEGVRARALIADIGSLKIHDRSGAAVTAAEFPRLRPFIPQVGDNAETIRTKLENFRREYDAILRDTYETYGPSNGYRQLPAVESALNSQGEPGRAGVQRPPIADFFRR